MAILAEVGLAVELCELLEDILKGTATLLSKEEQVATVLNVAVPVHTVCRIGTTMVAEEVGDISVCFLLITLDETSYGTGIYPVVLQEEVMPVMVATGKFVWTISTVVVTEHFQVNKGHARVMQDIMG